MKRTWIITGIGVALGALAGWIYWSQWGCTEGCTITGHPVNSTLYGALMGGLIGGMFKNEERGALRLRSGREEEKK
ncbi:MAG: hypothetical protein JST38_21905 [Bacteroidetes bacterium]|nr:hypothetical protein [Bacteroidota bacterium]MBS1943528.1 hypothetical protein [Bacteroidota bacterium]